MKHLMSKHLFFRKIIFVRQEFGHIYLVTGYMEIDLFKVIFSQ